MPRPLFTLPSRRQAIAELIFAAGVWGFGFIAARWALLDFGPFWTTALRFLIAFSCAAPLLVCNRDLRGRAGIFQFRLAAVPGLLIGLTLLLQTDGLQYTSVTRSGFITSLYIVFVPLLEWQFFRRRLPVSHFTWVITALVGAGLICQVEGGNWNRGDLLTLACSVCAALHILRLEAVADQIDSSFVFNIYQCFWAALLAASVAVAREAWPHTSIHLKPWIGILILSLWVQLVAFSIQVRSQRVLSPSVVSMLFLLESPFAAGYAFLFFRERLTLWQWLGATLILLAAAGTVRIQSEYLPEIALFKKRSRITD